MTSEPAGKPTVSGLGIDLAAQVWHHSGHGDGAIEVAFSRAGNRAGNTDHTDPTDPTDRLTRIARSGC